VSGVRDPVRVPVPLLAPCVLVSAFRRLCVPVPVCPVSLGCELRWDYVTLRTCLCMVALSQTLAILHMHHMGIPALTDCARPDHRTCT